MNVWKHGSHCLRLPGDMLIRDAITQLNAWFQTSAVVVARSGRILGILDRDSMIRALAEDADEFLKQRCADVVGMAGRPVAA